MGQDGAGTNHVPPSHALQKLAGPQAAPAPAKAQVLKVAELENRPLSVPVLMNQTLYDLEAVTWLHPFQGWYKASVGPSTKDFDHRQMGHLEPGEAQNNFGCGKVIGFWHVQSSFWMT